MPGPIRLVSSAGWRVGLWYAGIFAASVTLVGVLAYYLLSASLERRDHELLRVKLAEYASQYESGGLRALSASLGAQRTSGDPDAVLVRLVASNADVVLTSAPASWPPFQFESARELRFADDSEWRTVPSGSDQFNLELVSRRLFDGSLIEVGRTTIGRDRLLGDVRNLFGLLMLVVLVMGLAGGAAITRQALKPLRELRDVVQTIARTGQLSGRVTSGPDGDLVNDLSAVFNQMVARIETLVANMSDALDNVAHDLRTPIARLRARAEAALSAPPDADSAHAALADCVEEADSVIALLSALMDISEAQTGTMRLSLEPVAVRDVAADTIDLYEDTAEERGITLTSHVPEDMFVHGDRQRLRQALANLVDNALKYTGSGGHVTIGAEHIDSRQVAIIVADTGVGIAPEDMPRIWDRLYRARAGQSAAGLGLGLSLVRAIALAHGGRADVASTLDHGSTFQFIVPAAEPTKSV